MPIATIQRRGRQIGEIRIGAQVQAVKDGQPAVRRDGSPLMRPSKLEAFRFTTKSPTVAAAVAALLGGEARPVKLLSGDQSHEVFTTCTEIPVVVPPGDQAVSQWYELWSGGGCLRRCDGITEQLTQRPCMCPQDTEQRVNAAAAGEACKPTTRVNVMLPDLPDIGVWKLESHGFYAAVELGGAAELLAASRAAGVSIGAVLRLEQRQVKRGGKTNKFAVPVLEIVQTLRQVTELSAGTSGIAQALPPPPGALALIAGPSAPAALELESAQHAAQLIGEATTREQINAIGKAAKARGWLGELVEMADDTFVALSEYAVERRAELEQA